MIIKDGPYPGPLSYNMTPYMRAIIDDLSPYSPYTEIALMGGAQLGKTKTVIEPILGYWIEQHPAELAYFTGHSDLSDEAMQKLDNALDNSGVGKLIKSQSLRKTNKRTGDTTKKKEFPLGSLIAGSATNHKLLRQRTLQRIIGDDIEAAKSSSIESGDTVSLIRLRTNSLGKRKKIFWCSTPERKEASIIHKLYLQGDQKQWHIPCKHCGELITLDWENFFWETQEGLIVPGSVQYKCQKCKEDFDDSGKLDFNLSGRWIATNPKPTYPDLTSYYLPGWFSAPGMDSWEKIAIEYLEANPPGQQPIDNGKMKTWTNLRAGLPYEETFEEIKATQLQQNKNDYQVNEVPESLSMNNGNGRVVLLTCGADLNGTDADGRLDYEIIAWCENGSNYSVTHGSIGTFVPAIIKRKSDKEDAYRELWTYQEGRPFCIWDAFEKVLRTQFKVTSDVPRPLPIALTCLDTGYFKTHAYAFIERMINRGITIVGVKGHGDGAFKAFETGMGQAEIDKRVIKKGLETEYLYSLEVGYLKDKLAQYMQQKWGVNESGQPSNFMNFPQSSNGLYEWKNFFEHYESEKRQLKANTKGTGVQVEWVKKQPNSQNHMWDCRVYNMAAKEIWVMVLKEKYNNIKDANGYKIEINWAWYASGAAKAIQAMKTKPITLQR